jgi:ammonia channel protein AmtB
MIVEMIFNAVFLVIEGLLNKIPELSIDIVSQISGGILGMVELLSKTSFIMPWGSLLSALGVCVAFHSVKLVKDTVDWLIDKIPFV